MDVTINVNLTPKEARELMGLPDLRSLQDDALAEIRRGVMAQAEKISPDGLLKSWFMGSASAFDIVRDMTSGVLSHDSGVKAAGQAKDSHQG